MERRTSFSSSDLHVLGDDDPAVLSEGVQDETNASENPSNTRETKERPLARTETRAVRRLRVFILAILSLAVLASVGVYYFTADQEEEDFKAGFENQGLKVMRGFQDDSFRKLQALDSLSTSFTSYALATQAEWPFVTVQDSASHFEPFLSLTNAASLKILPIVGSRERLQWERYARAQQGWIDRDLEIQQERVSDMQDNSTRRRSLRTDAATVTKAFASNYTERSLQTNAETIQEQDRSEAEISRFIKTYVGVDISPGPFIVSWQYAPVIPNRWFVNFNQLAADGFEEEAQVLIKDKKAVISPTFAFEPGLDFQSTRDFVFTSQLLQASGQKIVYAAGEPINYIHYPVFDHHEGHNQTTVAILSATVHWKTYFVNMLPEDVHGLHAVVENSNGQMFTYEIHGDDAVFLGMEDLHEAEFDEYVMLANYSSFVTDSHQSQHLHYTGRPVDDEYISYRIRVYPSALFRQSYVTNKPLLYSLLMGLVFVATAVFFFVYDRLVERRQRIVLSEAVKSANVISELFPENVRARLMEEAGKQEDARTMANAGQKMEVTPSKPIADFFPETTILFADIVGFTAWSSVREPSQVFTLLEGLYAEFDRIARSNRVFKVETVGDCYVAATGLPVPTPDHAVSMARFAYRCASKVDSLTAKLELELGPGTADLSMRFGIHSGPCTAGVLRGEKSRFQLFGDTVNTAARMESTSMPGKIQVSEDTAALLQKAGKDWLVKREDGVIAKGKGEMATFWLELKTESMMTGTVHSRDSQDSSLYRSRNNDSVSDISKRLINWNVAVLTKLLQQIVARRESRLGSAVQKRSAGDISSCSHKGTVLDEVEEIIKLPEFDSTAFHNQKDPSTVTLGEKVEEQLRQFVTLVAALYRKNEFHNFEHASHVSMSVNKLLSRIVAPDIDYKTQSTVQAVASTLHDYTYGITSDPLTQFSCVFSALIHDAGHTGVPNTQLIKEDAKLAAIYRNKSVAEQNSVDISWAVLMDEQFSDLRNCIYINDVEYTRFRQLVVNSVMATDIMDPDLKVLRNKRWDTAFAAGNDSARELQNINRKATIVIEHLIQASDVSHTMQHWHVYRKWNRRLFREMTAAFQEGRSQSKPAEGWYKGEMGFFDFYIIPLAKKLKDCGVFGVSSDEYLKYAQQNRKEWQEKGEAIVAEMVEELVKEDASSASFADDEEEATTTEPGSSEENTSQKSLEDRLMKHLIGQSSSQDF